MSGLERRGAWIWLGSICVILIGAYLTRSPIVLGQGVVHEACNKPELQGAFISRSVEQARDEEARDQVLETLSCIASGSNPDNLIGATAVHAIFQIAGANRLIQDHLLRIIQNEKTNSVAMHTACQLIVYVADDYGRRMLLEQLVRDSDRTACGHLLQALAELGDQSFLDWLEARAAQLPAGHPVRIRFEALADEVRLQKDTGALLHRLRSNTPGIDAGWIVRQALRHGADRNEVRTAVLDRLGRTEDDEGPLQHTALVRACDEANLLTAQDAADYPAIPIVRQTLRAVSQHSFVPAWVTLPESKRAEFYRMTH